MKNMINHEQNTFPQLTGQAEGYWQQGENYTKSTQFPHSRETDWYLITVDKRGDWEQWPIGSHAAARKSADKKSWLLYLVVATKGVTNEITAYRDHSVMGWLKREEF